MESKTRTLKLIKLCVCVVITCLSLIYSCVPTKSMNVETQNKSAVETEDEREVTE